MEGPIASLPDRFSFLFGLQLDLHCCDCRPKQHADTPNAFHILFESSGVSSRVPICALAIGRRLAQFDPSFCSEYSFRVQTLGLQLYGLRTLVRAGLVLTQRIIALLASPYVPDRCGRETTCFIDVASINQADPVRRSVGLDLLGGFSRCSHSLSIDAQLPSFLFWTGGPS